jgi:hypothetical protein
LAQCGGENLLDRGDQPASAVGDHQQRTCQPAAGQVGQEISPGVGGFPRPWCQTDEHGFAFGGDAPRGQHRLGWRARVHPEERGVQEQVIEHDVVQASLCPCLVFGFDRCTHLGDSRFRDRCLVAEGVGEGRFDIADRQPTHERGDHQRLERVGLGDVLAEQA